MSLSPSAHRWLVLSLVVATSGTLPVLRAQDWAKPRLDNTPRHLEWVTVKQGQRDLRCFIAFPEVKEKAPVVVVIHEIFGLSDWVRGVTDQLAEAGFIAIAPDLLSGMAPGGGGSAELGSGDAVRSAISTLPPDQVTADLQAVLDYATKLPAANGKIAVAGFCWGGSQSFRFATNARGVRAAFVFYGSGPDAAEPLRRLECPVYGFYGGNDARVNASLPKTEELMKAAGKTFQPVIYEGAGHGFMRAGEAPDANGANQKARAEAWKRWNELLGRM